MINRVECDSKFKLGDLVSWVNSKGYEIEGRVSGYGVVGKDNSPVILTCWDKEGCYAIPEERLSAVELVECGFKPGETIWYNYETLPWATRVKFVRQDTNKFATVRKLDDIEALSVSIKSLSRIL